MVFLGLSSGQKNHRETVLDGDKKVVDEIALPRIILGSPRFRTDKYNLPAFRNGESVPSRGWLAFQR